MAAPAAFVRHLDDLTRVELENDQRIADLAETADPARQRVLRDDIKDGLASIQLLLGEARLLADEQDSEATKASMLTRLERHTAEKERLAANLRRASLLARQALEKAAAQEREDLLAGASVLASQDTRQRTQRADAGKVLQTSTNISDSLMRMRQSMAAELSRTAQTSQVLADSSQRLKQTAEETTSLDARTNQSRSLACRAMAIRHHTSAKHHAAACACPKPRARSLALPIRRASWTKARTARNAQHAPRRRLYHRSIIVSHCWVVSGRPLRLFRLICHLR